MGSEVLRIELKRSWTLGATLAAGHLACAMLIVLLGWSWQASVAALAVIAASLVISARESTLFCAEDSICALQISADHRLYVRARSRDWFECDVLGTTYVTALLSVLNLRECATGRIRHAVLLPDRLAKDDYRKLRAWLRWKPEDAGNRNLIV
jgi:hypothetical protein